MKKALGTSPDSPDESGEPLSLRSRELLELEDAECLVTGGAGFIGSNVVRTLLAHGARVTVLDNLLTGRRENLPEHEALRFVEGDVGTHTGMEHLVDGCDYVFHLAASVGNLRSLENPELDAVTNVLGSLRLFGACRDADVERIVYSSSSAIFGEAENLPIDEDAPWAPESFYALSKLAGERYAALFESLFHVPIVSLRYFNVFGVPMEKNDYSGVISIFFEQLKASRPLTIYGDGTQCRDFVYVSDVARANVLAAVRGKPGNVYHIGTGRPTTIRELAAVMAEISGGTSAVEFRDARAGEVKRSLARIDLARRELGFEPRYTLRAGLEEMWRLMSGAAPTALVL